MSTFRPAWMTPEWLRDQSAASASQALPTIPSTMATEILRQDAEIATLNGQLLDAQDEVANWKQETNNARKEVDRVTHAASKEIDRLVAEISKLTAHIDRLKDDAEQFNVRLSDMARQRDVLHGSVEELRAERATLTERIRFIEEENIESGKEMAAAIEDRERTNRRWREDTAAMESMRTEIATLTAEVAKLKEHSDHDAGEILRLAGDLASASGSLDRANLDYSELTKDCNKAEAERDAARAELACKGCGGTVGHHLAPDQGGCPGRFVIDGVPMVPAAHVDAARAENAGLRGLCEAAKDAQLKLVSERDAARAEVERLTVELQEAMQVRVSLEADLRAAIRDRNEFAASEVERFARDMWDNNHLLYRMPCDAGAAHRAAELRKAAGNVAPATSFEDWVRSYAVVGDESRKGEATPPEDLAIHGSDRTVYMRVVDGKVVEVATPPADRQPAVEAKVRVHKVTQTGEHFCEHFCEERKKLAEVEKREAEGVKLFDDLLATERAKVATMTIEIDAMRKRLAASEKAKRNLLAAAEMALGVIWSDTKTTAQEAVAKLVQCRDALRAAIAAERAGGAS